MKEQMRVRKEGNIKETQRESENIKEEIVFLKESWCKIQEEKNLLDIAAKNISAKITEAENKLEKKIREEG